MQSQQFSSVDVHGRVTLEVQHAIAQTDALPARNVAVAVHDGENSRLVQCAHTAIGQRHVAVAVFGSDSVADRAMIELEEILVQELAEAVREFLQDEILPILDDHRLKFRTLVAINGLGIAERERWATTPPREEDWELARRIRAGDLPENAVALLKEQVAQKLRVSNPRALAKYE